MFFARRLTDGNYICDSVLAMRGVQFGAYKRRFVGAARAVLSAERSGALSEAALPAYAHSNGLISFLFWERVRRVMRYLGDAPRGTVLDFGCGGGVMLPFLADRAKRVLAMDVDLAPLTSLQARIPRPANVEVYDARNVTISDIPTGSIEVVLALDVLEHVGDLDLTVERLGRLLAPGGELIVSGPTENVAYRIGRRIAGREFTGDYHVRGVAAIKRSLERLGLVKTIAVLFPPIPLFELYSVAPEAGSRDSASTP